MQPWNVSVPAQAAAEAAAAELDFAEETAAWTAENRRQMKHWMAQAGYRVFPSNTNFLLFQAPAWLKEFCAEKGFLIRDCSNFPGLDTRTSELPYFRICVRSSQENGALMEVLECAARIRKD